MGQVFRGEDGESGQPVAVTVLRVGLAPEREDLAAASLVALRDRLPRHVALPMLVDTGLVDGDPYVVTALPDGDPLDVALREFGPAKLVDALPRLRRVADALDAAAAVGLCHGRLQIGDIIVSVEQTLVTGLGLAPLVERLGIEVPARRPYAAPEVVRGGGSSPAADQYALGAIAYEWLTGHPVIAPAEIQVALAGVSRADQMGLAAAVGRALSADPESRFPTASAFVEALSAVVPAVAKPRPQRAARVVAPRLAFDEEDAGASASAQVAMDLTLRPSIVDEDPVATPDEPAEPSRDRPLAMDALRVETGPNTRDGLVADVVSEDVGAPAPAIAPPSASQPSWARWSLGAAALIAAFMAGGWGLLRLGTPSTPPASRVVAAAPAAPAAVPVSGDRPSAATAPTPARPAALVGAARTTRPPASSTRPTSTPPTAGASRAAARPATGRLLVRSSPGGAEVFVNGVRRGVTPVAVRDLGLGTYGVRVVRAGFAPSEQRVVLDSGRPARSVEVTLARVGEAVATTTATGALVVESRPAGARVMVDGTAAGRTPLTMTAVSAGAHAVRIEQAGYGPISTTARVEPGASVRVAVTLTPNSERPR